MPEAGQQRGIWIPSGNLTLDSSNEHPFHSTALSVTPSRHGLFPIPLNSLGRRWSELLWAKASLDSRDLAWQVQTVLPIVEEVAGLLIGDGKLQVTDAIQPRIGVSEEL